MWMCCVRPRDASLVPGRPLIPTGGDDSPGTSDPLIRCFYSISQGCDGRWSGSRILKHFGASLLFRKALFQSIRVFFIDFFALLEVE